MSYRQDIIIVREYNGVGIDKFLNGYDMKSQRLLTRKLYNGRIVYVRGKNDLVGLPTLRKQPKVHIVFDFSLPF